MSLAEQPLKKRKLYEQLRESPPSPSSPPPPTPPPQPPSQPLSHEEIIRRQRNLEEIRKVFNCVKQLKCCIAEKDDRRCVAELEQSYLCLITASRGSLSMQRMVADLIPRYASYCPTALEAAAKVVINMHNCSLGVISSGEDFDGAAFETAEACIFGLVDISQAAAKEAPTSSVIHGICSAVFLSVFSFLISSFEGKDIFQIIDKEILKIQDAKDFNIEFKHKFLDEGDYPLLKLSKSRAACFLRILFSFPKYSIATCFELFDKTTREGTHHLEGHYFLEQLINELDCAVSDYLTHRSGEDKSTAGGKDVIRDQLVSESDHISEKASPVYRNCLLGMALSRDLALKSWIFSKYRKLCKSASPQVISDITFALEKIFESFTEKLKEEDNHIDGDDRESIQSKYINQYSVPREASQQGTSSEVTGKDFSSTVYDQSCQENVADKFSVKHLKRSSSYHSTGSSNLDTGESRSTDFDFRGPGDSSDTRSFLPRELPNQQSQSPMARTPVDLRKNHASSMDPFAPSLTSSSGGVNRSFGSPKHQLSLPQPPHNLGIMTQVGQGFQPNWHLVGHRGMPDYGPRHPDNMFMGPSPGGGRVVSSFAERMWMYRRPEAEMYSRPGGISCIPAPTLGPPIPSPPPVQTPPFRPLNFPPSSWDARGFNCHFVHPISPGVMPNMSNIHHNPIPPPFIPASVTPLVQLHGTAHVSFDQMFSLPVVTPQPAISPLPPSQPDIQLPPPPSQPPPPYPQPPLAPPPSSPPPPSEFFNSGCSIRCQWHGTLSKSGIPYCTVYAQRVDSDICKYSNEMAEPSEWPTKLDMTKRTDFRHVKTTFSNTPPHKREVCWLLPSDQGDHHKGFQDFILYLQQRDCAGVIKIPAVKTMWARILFILPYSPGTCSMLAIAPNSSLCLIGLILPKETNSEWV